MTALETKADAEALINKEGIEYVSVRFTDLIGVQQHFTVPASEFLKDAFTDGMPFDGSSVEGFQAINESDMKLVLGVHIVSPIASDLIAEAEQLVGNHVPLADAAKLIHPHPTFSESFGEALLKADGRPLHTR